MRRGVRFGFGMVINAFLVVFVWMLKVVDVADRWRTQLLKVLAWYVVSGFAE